MKKEINLTVNNEKISTMVDSHKTLLQFLRDDLGLTGTKEGCSAGECGACTVILNKKAVTSCIVLALEADGAEVLTIESESINGELSKLQDSFIKYNALQCGFCTPGMIMSARALLMRNPNPSEDEIVEAMQGNLCRCTGYKSIKQAVLQASKGEDEL